MTSVLEYSWTNLLPESFFRRWMPVARNSLFSAALCSGIYDLLSPIYSWKQQQFILWENGIDHLSAIASAELAWLSAISNHKYHVLLLFQEFNLWMTFRVISLVLKVTFYIGSGLSNSTAFRKSHATQIPTCGCKKCLSKNLLSFLSFPVWRNLGYCKVCIQCLFRKYCYSGRKSHAMWKRNAFL